MKPSHFLNRNTAFCAISLASLVVTLAIAAAVKTRSQQPQVLSKNGKDVLLKQLEESVDQPLRIVRGDDCPLDIVQANVKEIAGPDFTRLTGRVTNLGTVSTVPEITLVNSSGKTITGFVVSIRDPQSRTTQTITNLKTSMSPGGTVVVHRDYFVGPEKVVRASDKGRSQHAWSQPRMDSEKYWLTFAARADIYIAVGAVIFEDGTRWLLKDGGDVK